MDGPTVFVVDDDPAVLESVAFLLKSNGHAVECFPTAQAFLASYDAVFPGCLLLDIRMPGMGGLELQERLAAKRIDIPIIIMTGHGDVPMAVRAIKGGALDFIEKPFKDKVLLDRIHEAFELDRVTRGKKAERQTILAAVSTLTPRELEIMQLLMAGSMKNKEMAEKLNISRKTLDVHRGRILTKMQCRSLVELARKMRRASDGLDRVVPASS